jgi:simple sugar transport system ATP-binding protein
MIGAALSGESTWEPGAAGEIVVRAERLKLRDSRKELVVRDADFVVRAGEIVGIAGVEGSGYHQLLLALAGRFPVSAGMLHRPASVSIIPEDRHRDAVVLEFSLAENEAIRGAGRRRGSMRWREGAKRVADMIQRHDVRATGPGTPMRMLSGGNQQKFVLARELEPRPQLIVAENPTRGLDVRAAAFVRAELRIARGRGAAVVVYSSDLDEILELADRVLVMHAGATREVPRDRNRIGAAMLGAE